MDQSHISVCRHYFQVMFRRTCNRQQINNVSGSFAKRDIKYDNYRQLLDYHNTSARGRLRNCGKANQQWSEVGNSRRTGTPVRCAEDVEAGQQDMRHISIETIVVKQVSSSFSCSSCHSHSIRPPSLPFVIICRTSSNIPQRGSIEPGDLGPLFLSCLPLAANGDQLEPYLGT